MFVLRELPRGPSHVTQHCSAHPQRLYHLSLLVFPLQPLLPSPPAGFSSLQVHSLCLSIFLSNGLSVLITHGLVSAVSFNQSNHVPSGIIEGQKLFVVLETGCTKAIEDCGRYSPIVQTNGRYDIIFLVLYPLKNASARVDAWYSTLNSKINDSTPSFRGTPCIQSQV